MPDLDRPVVVLVEWRDSGDVSAENATWWDRTEALKRAARLIDQTMLSAGFLLHRDEKGVVLASMLNRHGDTVGLVSFIPNGQIVSVRLWNGREGPDA